MFAHNSVRYRQSLSIATKSCPATPQFKKYMQQLTLGGIAYNAFEGQAKQEPEQLPLRNLPGTCIDYTRCCITKAFLILRQALLGDWPGEPGGAENRHEEPA